MTIRGTLTDNADNTEWVTDKDNGYGEQVLLITFAAIGSLLF